jgi:uncharacterized protein YcfJ
LAIVALCLAGTATGEVILYEGEGFGGRSFRADRPVDNFDHMGFNDRASSLVVTRRAWEVCEHAHFGGRCVVLQPGRYDSLRRMGLENRISSLRPAGHQQARVEPPPITAAPVYAYRRRPDETLYEANVTYVRAVVGPPEQRCWVEREQVVQQNAPNVPGAIAGAIIGGILGHQVGGGRGQDVATAAGAVGGAAVGANVARGAQIQERDVERCRQVSSHGRPEYWDVSYVFRGQEHRVQMSSPPGRTILVNARGEPRV